jgi:hypothetical protein
VPQDSSYQDSAALNIITDILFVGPHVAFTLLRQLMHHIQKQHSVPECGLPMGCFVFHICCQNNSSNSIMLTKI